jgi:hypothetical protein
MAWWEIRKMRNGGWKGLVASGYRDEKVEGR